MPFGSNTKTRIAAETRAEFFGDHQRQKIHSRLVDVPATEEPWWWHEYLLDEWKRSHRVDQIKRDSRTGLQRSLDEWNRQQQSRYGGSFQPSSTGMPRHEVWADG